MPKGPSATYKPTWERANQNTFHRFVLRRPKYFSDLFIYYYYLFRAEAERLAAERLLEEAKALIEDAKIRVDKDEVEVNKSTASERVWFKRSC